MVLDRNNLSPSRWHGQCVRLKELQKQQKKHFPQKPLVQGRLLRELQNTWMPWHRLKCSMREKTSRLMHISVPVCTRAAPRCARALCMASKGVTYVCRWADDLTKCHWGSRSFLPSRRACDPWRKWSALWHAAESCPPLGWHGPACPDPHRSPVYHLHRQVHIYSRYYILDTILHTSSSFFQQSEHMYFSTWTEKKTKKKLTVSCWKYVQPMGDWNCRLGQYVRHDIQLVSHYYNINSKPRGLISH